MGGVVTPYYLDWNNVTMPLEHRNLSYLHHDRIDIIY